MKFKFRHFLILLFVLNLIQCIFSPIVRDEAYYWIFGQNLDWGFFDHPPMVALMSFLGDLFFKGEIGHRFVTSLMSVGLAYFMWMLIPEEVRERKNTLLIFALVYLSNPLFSLYGFITTPDAPLLFFSGAYLLVFQDFTKRQNLKNSILLGFLMACLIYSKYHGILVIFFTVASNLRLFRKGYFYLSGILGIALYLPHLIWQFDNDFISFNYHLSYRSVLFEWKNVFEYFMNIILVLNPLIFTFFIFAIRAKNEGNGRTRLMNFTFWGFFLFFLFTASRGHVEPHWIAVACIPYTIYIVHFIVMNEKYLKALKITASISISLILIVRIIAILPLNIKSEFHNENAAFYEEVVEQADGRNIVFINSYAHASKFSFHTGIPSFSYNFISYRKNQYDLLDRMDEFHGKNTMAVLFWPLKRFDHKVTKSGEEFYYKYIDNMPLINNLKVDVLEYENSVEKGKRNQLKLMVHNPYNIDIELGKTGFPATWDIYFFYLDKERHGGIALEDIGIKTLKANSSIEVTAYYESDVKPGKYTFGITLRPKDLFPITLSKRTHPIEILP